MPENVSVSAALDHASARREREVSARVMLRVRDQDQVCERIRRQLQRAQRKVGPDVAVRDQEGRIAEERQRSEQAAAGAERLGALLAVADREAERRAVSERFADALALPGEVDHDVAHAEFVQRREVILDQPVAADFEHRLRQLLGQRAHALAAPGSEDHRFQRA